MLEAWKIAVISICAAIFILINAGVMCYFFRKSKEQQQQEKKQDLKTTFDVEKQEKIHDDTGIEKDQMEKYGQQFAIVTSAQTVLSPPRHPNTSYTYQPVPVPEQCQLKVFSLSPLHQLPNDPITTTDSSSLRTITPFQPTVTTPDTWRGPTPLFTQYPGN